MKKVLLFLALPFILAAQDTLTELPQNPWYANNSWASKSTSFIYAPSKIGDQQRVITVMESPDYSYSPYSDPTYVQGRLNRVNPYRPLKQYVVIDPFKNLDNKGREKK